MSSPKTPTDLTLHRTHWNKLPLEVMYKIVIDLEAKKRTVEIVQQYDLSSKSIQKIKKHSERIKLEFEARRKRKKITDEISTLTTIQTPECQNVSSVIRKRARGQHQLHFPTPTCFVQTPVLQETAMDTPCPDKRQTRQRLSKSASFASTPTSGTKSKMGRNISKSYFGERAKSGERLKNSENDNIFKLMQTDLRSYLRQPVTSRKISKDTKQLSKSNSLDMKQRASSEDMTQTYKKPRKSECRKNSIKRSSSLRQREKFECKTFEEVETSDVEDESDDYDEIREIKNSYSGWYEFLLDENNLVFIPPVSIFKHAPLVDVWENLAVPGRVIEVANPFVHCSREVNWLAHVVRFAGYKALVEFESFGMNPKFMTWMTYCSNFPKPIGYSDKNRIVLHPPHEVQAKFPDFLSRGRNVLRAETRETISNNHGSLIQKELEKWQRFLVNTKLEVMDKTKISRMRVACVKAVVGDRMHVNYIIEPKPNDSGFWFNVNSELVHPVGWSQSVGHDIYGVSVSEKFPPLHFREYSDDIQLEKGQMLEVRHPNLPGVICAASVSRVLKHGYFVVKIQTFIEEVKQPTKFTFHVTSPYIFNCGFCERHGIELVPPYGESSEAFKWNDYLQRLNLKMALFDYISLFLEQRTHQFKPGMKMEGVNITDPACLRPCTVIRTVAHLLYINYDGWTDENPIHYSKAWMDSESPDIYPIGYAEMVGLEFEGYVGPINPNHFKHYADKAEEQVENNEYIFKMFEDLYGHEFVKLSP